MHAYPKWKYHATEAAVVVDDKKSDEELGDDWFDTPAEAMESADRQAAAQGAEGDDTKITEEERLGLLDLAKSMGLKPHYKLSGDKLLTMITDERERLAKEKAE